MARPLLRLLATCTLLVSCGGSNEPASAPASDAPPPAEPPAAAPAAAAETPPASEPVAKEPEPKPAEPAAPKAEAPAGDDAPRDVRYTQSPEGLKVEVSGVRFFVSASTVKAGGGHRVKVTVRAEASDKKGHSLLDTDNGPLALAGSVTRKGETTKFGDERKGEAEKKVPASGSVEFSREWPGKGGDKPLASGDSLELSVGLWGVGEAAGSTRPLRKFALVTAKADKNSARAIVEAPAGIAK